MLSIRIDNRHQHSQHLHEAGELLLGRQPNAGEAHVIIEDDYVSRRQLLIQEASSTRVRFRNLGSNELELANGNRITTGSDGEVDLPAQIKVGYTWIRLDWQDHRATIDIKSASSNTVSCFETISVDPTSLTDTTNDASIASLGDTPPAEKLAMWFETLNNVQRSAVGSTAFYQETAQAIVRLVGLTRGIVLLRKGDAWEIVATASESEEAQSAYSTSVLEQVLAKKQTFYGNPQNMSARASLVSIEAVVGSPIFDACRNVVGMLYGSRDLKLGTVEQFEITPLEAQVVQMLASSITVGLNRQLMEEQLQQAQQLAAVGQALGFILHDLRGPLGNAQQLVGMLRANETSQIPREDQLDFVEDSVDIALQLLNDSLEFCRGQVQVRPVRGLFKDLFDKHLRLLRLSLEGYDVQLRVEARADLELVVDPDRMSRVIRNLAKNAAEALQGRPNATVSVGAEALPKETKIWVADNGPGLPEQVQARLFQPFATHGKKGGTGFGLAIAKQLVEAHRGKIQVSSSDAGTRFTISIPSSLDPQVQVEVSDNEEQSLPLANGSATKEISPRRILLAEDVPLNQKLVKGLLGKLGHEISIVENGSQAVEAFRRERFDLVLMDLEMPEMGGIDATLIIRSEEDHRGIRTPIVALSGHEDQAIIEQCKEAGMDHFLTKPIQPAEIQKILASLTRSS